MDIEHGALLFGLTAGSVAGWLGARAGMPWWLSPLGLAIGSLVWAWVLK